MEQSQPAVTVDRPCNHLPNLQADITYTLNAAQYMPSTTTHVAPGCKQEERIADRTMVQTVSPSPQRGSLYHPGPNLIFPSHPTLAHHMEPWGPTPRY